MKKHELAFRLYRCEQALELANKRFSEKGEFGILPDYTNGPSFKDAKKEIKEILNYENR
jgi:hypothetical protein